MSAVKTPTRIRDCTGSSPHLLVVETEDESSWGELADQFIALGKWLHKNPDVDVSSINIDRMGGDGPDYLAVCVTNVSGVIESAYFGE